MVCFIFDVLIFDKYVSFYCIKYKFFIYKYIK